MNTLPTQSNPVTTLPKLMTADEVAAYLSCTRNRVYDLAKENLIPYVKMGRHYRFDPTKIAQWIAEGGQGFEGGWRKETA